MSYESGCQGKRTYETKGDAKRAEKHMRTTVGGDRQHAYHCRYCGFWHLGHGGAHVDFDAVDRDEVLRFRAAQLEFMLLEERDALATAQTPTQRSYYEKQIAGFEQELSDVLDEINALIQVETTNV